MNNYKDLKVWQKIAEGSGRNTKRDFNNFLGISYGSTCELDIQLIIASRVNFLSDVDLETLEKEIDEIQKMNWALKKSLNLSDN